MKCRKLVRLLCLGLVVFFIGSTSASALTTQEKLKYARHLIGSISDPTPLEKAKYAGFMGPASKFTPLEKEKYAKAFMEAASGLTPQEKEKYAKYLAGYAGEFTPQEREKYSDIFMKYALVIPPQEKSQYANLPGVQHIKKIKPNGDYTYMVKMAALAPKVSAGLPKLKM